MLYDYPSYYELAFSFRDVGAETSFMNSCITRYSLIPVKSVLEIGCGPAPHAGVLTSSCGYRYTGIDINEKMLAYSRDKWQRCQPPPTFLQKDMVDFELDQPVDFVFVMLGSLYLRNANEIVSHFDSVARALAPGGLYFMDWCIQFEDPLNYKDNNAFSIERDGIRLESRIDIKLVDPSTQLYEETWLVDVFDRSCRHQFNMRDRSKAILPDEFLRFLENRNDFEFIGWWKDWDLAQPIHDGCEILRPFTLLRRV